MMFDPATLTPSKRALGMICAIAAGTAAATTAEPLVAAGIASIAGLFTNFAANDIQQVWEQRANNPKYKILNDDLTKLIGDAIAYVIYEKSKDSSVKAEKKELERVAKIASETFLQLAEHPDFLELADQNLPDLFRRAAEKPNDELRLLSLPTWIRFVEILRENAALPSNAKSTEELAERLRIQLFPAVQEMVKRNFGGDGRAYAVLSLDMSATILKYTVQNFEQHGVTQQNLQLVIDKLDDIQAKQLTVLTPDQAGDLSWLAVEFVKNRQRWRETHQYAKEAAIGIAKIHEQQQLESERNSRIEAMLKENFANKTAGVDPTQKQLPPELIEKAKLLLERGNQEQQALAEIALKNHSAADALIQELKLNPLAEAFRLLTLEGDNWYQAGEFDRAIEPYEQAMALRPNDIIARNNVAMAHQCARLGNISEHVECSIVIHTQSLEFLLAESQHADWAMTLNNLGVAWSNLPSGDQETNLQHAIEAHEGALLVYTREDYPDSWAMTQNNLGVAWRNLPSGDQRKNLQRAIVAFEAALEIYTHEAHPVAWAATQNNLGNAWSKLPSGDRVANLHRAIKAYEAALLVRTRAAHPVDWALTQNNLANAWSNLPSSDQGTYLLRAIATYEAALEIFTRAAYPVDWAMTQNNFGLALAKLSSGDRGTNLQRAIGVYEAALEIYTRREHPVSYAFTNHNLGNAWFDLPTGDREANLQRAIAAYEAVLDIYTRASQPKIWAATQHNLGIACIKMGEIYIELGCKWLHRAIGCLKGALLFYTLEKDPSEHQGTVKGLTIARFVYEAGCANQIPFDEIAPAE